MPKLPPQNEQLQGLQGVWACGTSEYSFDKGARRRAATHGTDQG